MADKQVYFRLDEEVWLNFRAECQRRRTSATKELIRFMTEQLAAWEAEPLPRSRPTPKE